MDTGLQVIAIGVGATTVVDAWSLARRAWLGVPLPDYALVGRWFAHMPRGVFRHAAIARAAPVRGERGVGWIAHYAIGVAFAAGLPLLWGESWLRDPTPVPALLVGIGSVAAPFLLMQPAMGAGIAARLTPRPNAARVQGVATHVVFALGLYLAARVVAFAAP